MAAAALYIVTFKLAAFTNNNITYNHKQPVAAAALHTVTFTPQQVATFTNSNITYDDRHISNT